MAKVSPLRIDTELGKLPLKDKGLEMIEFESPAELRRNQLEKMELRSRGIWVVGRPVSS